LERIQALSIKDEFWFLEVEQNTRSNTFLFAIASLNKRRESVKKPLRIVHHFASEAHDFLCCIECLIRHAERAFQAVAQARKHLGDHDDARSKGTHFEAGVAYRIGRLVEGSFAICTPAPATPAILEMNPRASAIVNRKDVR
jgi:hypothetical protein